jgi:LPS-assembly protein
MKKCLYHFIAALLLVVWWEASVSAENRAIYTVQVLSSGDKEKIIRAARTLESSEKDGVRVEKIGGLCVLRIGRYVQKGEGLPCLRRVKKRYGSAFLRRAYDIPARTVYAGTVPAEGPESTVPPEAYVEKPAPARDDVTPEKNAVENGGPATAAGGKKPVFRGMVQDGEGRPVAGATVQILGIPLAPVRTGDDGSFAVSGLSPGNVFSLKISGEGYDTLRTPVMEIPASIKEEPEHYTLRPLSAAPPPRVPPVSASPEPSPSPPAEEALPSRPEPLPAGQEQSPGTGVTIEADSISYERDADTYHAQGSVVMTYSGGILTADSVIMSMATDDALAEGDVVVKSGNDLLEGERIVLNIVSKMGIAYQGKAFISQNHFYLKGEKIEKKGEKTYRVLDATATTCEGDSPDWQLKGRTLDVTMDGYGTLTDAKMLAKDTTLLYVPYLLFPAKTKRQSGLLYPHITYSQGKNGWDVEVPYYWAISESSDATFYQRYMDKRGFKEGVEYRYFLDKDSYGTFYGDYLNDGLRATETAGNISRDWQSDQQRWSFYLNHQTAFSPTSYVRADIMKVSDSWYFRDFNSYNYYLGNYSRQEGQFRKISFLGDQSLGAVDSTVRFVKNWPLYNLTGLVKYSDDLTSATNNAATLQRYPEITFTGIKRPIMGSAYNLEFAGSYDYFYRGEGQKGQLYDVVPVLSRPFNLGVYLQVNPEIAMRETYWSRDDSDPGGNKQGNRPLYRLSFNLNTEVHRIFNLGGRTLDKIRHGIKPELTYTYIPYADQPDMPNYVTAVSEQNTLTYGFTNTFIARMKEKDGRASYREFLRFKLSQTYDLKEARRGEVSSGPERRPFSDVDMELDFLPLSYLSFAARNKFSVNSGEWKQMNYDLSLRDERGDAATVGYRYTQNALYTPNFLSVQNFLYTQNAPCAQSALEQINLALNAVITRSIAATYVLRRNELDHKTLEETYGLKYRKQCWATEVQYSKRENDTIYMVLISLYGLGQFGQEVWKTATTPQ